MEVKTNVPTGKDESGKPTYTEVAVEYDFGANLAEFVERFTEDCAFQAAVGSAKTGLRSRVKALKIAGKSDDEIQAEVSTWVYGVAAPRVVADPKAATIAAFGQMTQEEKMAFLAELGVEV